MNLATKPRTSVRDVIVPLVLAVFLFYGIFLPTSQAGTILDLTTYNTRAFLPLIGLYIVLLLHARVTRLWRLKLGALTINTLLLLFTILSPYTTYTLGVLLIYFTLSLLFITDLRFLPCNELALRWIFVFFNLALIVPAVLIVAGFDPIGTFVVQNYASWYPELVPNMMRLHKPVLTFGTHSLAGFFFYLGFYACLRVYIGFRSPLFIFFALVYIALELFVSSVTSYFFAGWGVLQLFVHAIRFRSRSRVIALVYIGVVIIAGCGLSYVLLQDPVRDAILTVVESPTGGLVARYAEAGQLMVNLDFIRNHPFSGIGASYTNELRYVDSGIIEHTIRGTALLTMVLYATFWIFLKLNCASRAMAIVLFGAFIAFDVGFSVFLYPRTLYVLPFIVIVINRLGVTAEERNKSRKSATARMLKSQPNMVCRGTAVKVLTR